MSRAAAAADDAAGAAPGEGPSRGALRPFLLDRLSDDWLTRHTVGPGDAVPPFHLVLTDEEYRRSVVRDLRWLLNTTAPPAPCGVRDDPRVAASVLNYGLPDFARINIADVRGPRFGNMVRRAIQRFEPRILARTLDVRIAVAGPAAVVSIVIEGSLWALPVPQTLRLRGELDLAGSRQWQLAET